MRRVLLVACLTLLAGAPAAQAATVATGGGTLRVSAAPGEANQLRIAEETLPDGLPGIVVTETGAPLSAGPGCLADPLDATRVLCPAAGLGSVSADLGDGDDRAELATLLPAQASGGEGSDFLSGSPAADRLSGGPGDDELVGWDGDDSLDGGRGADSADAGDGRDAILMRDRSTDEALCGEGRDTVRAEVLDSLDTACESVDYGRAGSVGRLRAITGGGRFVPVPGQPWARVDRRILPGVLYLVRKFKVRIGDGFAMQGHARLGEHPLGLAVDLYPGPGGSWKQVARLARWAEPRQNRPRLPFRWVGWNGDPNHGWGDHLHLSWDHSPGRPGRPVRTAWVFQVSR